MLLPDGLFKAFLIVGAAFLAYGYFGVLLVFSYYLLNWLMSSPST